MTLRKKPPVIAPLESLPGLYRGLKPAIEARLGEFSRIWERSDDRELFIELVFCLLTPQSGARRCWDAVRGLDESGLLLDGSYDDLRGRLRTVRFMNTKAANIVKAREFFMRGGASISKILSAEKDDTARREWLRLSVRGLGMKEASHYLRNIGLGASLAILDRHIMRRLAGYGAIPSIPAGLSPSRYREIEGAYLAFADAIGIEPLHLDLLFWYDATGDMFK